MKRSHVREETNQFLLKNIECLERIDKAVRTKDVQELVAGISELQDLVKSSEFEAMKAGKTNPREIFMMKALCRQLLCRLDGLTRQGEYLIDLVRAEMKKKMDCSKNTVSSSLVRGIDVSG